MGVIRPCIPALHKEEIADYLIISTMKNDEKDMGCSMKEKVP